LGAGFSGKIEWGTWWALLGSPLGAGFSGKIGWGTWWALLGSPLGAGFFQKFGRRTFLFAKKNILVFDNLAYFVGRGAARAVNLFYGVDDC
jgi:hypothetical protein